MIQIVRESGIRNNIIFSPDEHLTFGQNLLEYNCLLFGTLGQRNTFQHRTTLHQRVPLFVIRNIWPHGLIPLEYHSHPHAEHPDHDLNILEYNIQSFLTSSKPSKHSHGQQLSFKTSVHTVSESSSTKIVIRNPCHSGHGILEYYNIHSEHLAIQSCPCSILYLSKSFGTSMLAMRI